jgi:hypothetical protein
MAVPEAELRTFVILRPMPGVGSKTTEDEAHEMAQKSIAVIKALRDEGMRLEWQVSYLAGDLSVCIYKADDKGTLLEHASRLGIPADIQEPVSFTVTPAWAEKC